MARMCVFVADYDIKGEVKYRTIHNMTVPSDNTLQILLADGYLEMRVADLFGENCKPDEVRIEAE